MHIPKTIINKLIPFFPKHHYQEIVKQAKASLDKPTKKGCLEVANGTSWARVCLPSNGGTSKLSKEDEVTELTQFLIPQDNLEDIGYQNTLEEAAIGFDEEEFEECFEVLSDLSPYQSETLKRLAKLAEDFPQFKDSYQPGDEQNYITLELYELKKIIELAIAVAEASEINYPVITFSTQNNQPIHWELKDRYFEQETYQADGLIAPVITLTRLPRS